MKDPERHGSYVRKVSEEARRYAQDLLGENEKLRLLVASLESENSRLQDELRSSGGLPKENEVLRGLVATLEKEKLRLQEQLLTIRDQFDRHQQEQSRLRHQLEEIEKENKRFAEQYVQVEEQSSNLANLYVASYQLHGTIERGEVVTVIQEIVANLIGSEEMALFELDESGTQLDLIASVGLDAATFGSLSATDGLIGRSVQSGEILVSADAEATDEPLAHEKGLTACIPLRVQERVSGAIALFRLLPQKAGHFADIDRELFGLLAAHAATALYCATLHARLGTSPTTAMR